ncbi:MAG: hypothetical protein ACR2JR_11805 [Rubrobacteraceae bacterium]
MSKLSKLTLGLATVSPLFLVAAFASILAATILLFPEAPAQGSEELPDEFFEAFARHFVLVFLGIATLFLAVLLAIAMPLILVLHALSSDEIDEEQKSTWVVVLLLGGILVAPFYWYLHVWRDP